MASVTVERGSPRSCAVSVKLRRSTTRVKTFNSPKRSTGSFSKDSTRLFSYNEQSCRILLDYPAEEKSHSRFHIEAHGAALTGGPTNDQQNQQSSACDGRFTRDRRG